MRRDGALPLPCDIYTDVFRPAVPGRATPRSSLEPVMLRQRVEPLIPA